MAEHGGGSGRAETLKMRLCKVIPRDHQEPHPKSRRVRGRCSPRNARQCARCIQAGWVGGVWMPGRAGDRPHESHRPIRAMTFLCEKVRNLNDEIIFRKDLRSMGSPNGRDSVSYPQHVPPVKRLFTNSFAARRLDFKRISELVASPGGPRVIVLRNTGVHDTMHE